MPALTFIWEVDGTPTSVNSVVLRDPAAAYGLRETVSGDVIIADGVALTEGTPGEYELDVTGYGLDEETIYDWWAQVIYDGETYYVQRYINLIGGVIPTPDDDDDGEGELPTNDELVLAFDEPANFSDPSTFEYARDWLVSSETFVRGAMRIGVVDLDGARDAARDRIHNEETNDEGDEAEAAETAPDLPPPVNDKPRAIVRTESNTRRQAGTGTWAGDGELLIDVEVLLPAAYVINPVDHNATEWAARFAGARQWTRRLAETIRTELMATSGAGSVDGVPYLNATDIDFEQVPSFADNEDPNQFTWMGWTYRVRWN